MIRAARTTHWLLALGLALATAVPVHGGLFDRYYTICIEEIIEIDPGWIPVGCEVVDCCPGCPGPGVLDWLIRVEGDPIVDLTLEWENLPAAQREQFGMEGEATWDGDNLTVVGGETRIKGIPARWDGRPPVAVPRLSLRPEFTERYTRERAQSPDEPFEEDAGTIEVTILQYLGPVVVNEYRLKYLIRWCPPPILRQDDIDLDNNDANDNAVTLLDGRRSSGCINDELGRGTDIIGKGNVLSRGTCRSEASVFSDDDAFQLVENVNVYTDGVGDTLPVDQTPNLLNNPVNVWLVRGGAAGVAAGDVANANLLYNTSNCGLSFTGVQQNAAGAAGIVTQANACSGPWLAAVQGSAFYNAGQLNAYYINGGFTAFNCIADRNISVVGQNANNQSLAHEFGHAFSIGHTNAIAAIPNTNVMHGGGAGRNKFTEGQCFRVNTEPDSQVNVNGVRGGPTRNCPDGTASDACPDLALDPVPD